MALGFPKNITILLIFILFISCSKKEEVIKLTPKPNAHIVILGNTFAERLQYHNYFEALLYKSFPEHNLKVRNMSWSADEVNLQPRPLHFGTTDEHLHQQKPDIIIACYGLNEAFKGPDSLESFKTQLSSYLQHLKSQNYNGTSAPQVILASPIAHEKLGGFLPDPTEHNKNLALYTKGMEEVAKNLEVPFVNLYNPTKKLMDTGKDSLTINGIHLNDRGYREVSEFLARALGFSVTTWKDEPDFNSLKKVIGYKNQHFFYQFRAVNGEYIYGRRKEPFGVISFPPEFEKLENMVARLDTLVWNGSKEGAVADTKKAWRIVSDTKQIENEGPGYSKFPPSTDQFIIQDGYKIELFASEIDFPIGNPVSLTFDPQGRMWVATLPSYPHYYPGSPPNDKIIILEDTNNDGKADKHTVFADSLYLPLGFELGDGGVYVTQAPDFVFLKDTDGDGKADLKKTLLSGFGTEDSHHSISAYTWGPDGALYMHEGTFIHTQVETPHGPVRTAYGATFRYEPRTMKLEPYVSYPYANPWANTFTRDGTHLIGDASNGNNYFATPLTVAIDYPKKHLDMKDFPDKKVRPTSGHELISSRHFPESAQGNYIINNNIGFQGIKQYKITEEGSGIKGREIEPFLQSKDLNFRPVDLQFGPDGALYVVDWFNPLIGHMQHSLRDPERDHSHGRIWRITHKNSPLLQPTDLTKLSAEELLDQLKAHEDRLRYRVRVQLREFKAEEILPVLENWHKNLDQNHPDYEQHKLEALWVYQQFHQPDKSLLNELLNAKSHNIRAAATKVLYHWNGQIQNSFDKLVKMSQDASPRVRIEAIAALSHFKSEATVKALLATTDLPVDYYIDYALKESFKHLQPVWMEMFRKDKNFLADAPEKANYLLGALSSARELALPEYFFKDDPNAAIYARKPLTSQDFKSLSEATAVTRFWITRKDVPDTDRENGLKMLSTSTGKHGVDILLEEITRLDSDKENHGLHGLALLLARQNIEDIRKRESQLEILAEKAQKPLVKEVLYALLSEVRQDISETRTLAMKSPENYSAFIRSTQWIKSEKPKKEMYPEIVKALNSSTTSNQSREASHEIKVSAIESLAHMDQEINEVVGILSAHVQPNGTYTNEAVKTLLMIPEDALAKTDLLPVRNNLIKLIKKIPEKERVKHLSNDVIDLGKKVAELLPAEEGKELAAIISKAEKTVIYISTVPEKMLFDLKEFSVQAGRPVELIFVNQDNMPHNLLILKPNTLEVVGIMAEDMAKTADGYQKHFVPETDKVIAATPLLNAGKEFTLTFMAPEQPGNYPFVCTFPGHWKMMNGNMKVVSKENL